ncbi:MAG: zf-HC2 domain-containing protein [Nitrospira sp.]|nr:zf-HC2 domain-containing protein [Nitrospira sp.]MCA9480568.1 zf-HC2 domain-containing protein [Nitrospira sp.]MCB9711857.1 zf-HC2 domain-containing protein [Nitrospiraceae bacterium]MDR4487521.1 zf-HC2 domain-containing protein [Nitrospirales bacterium]HQU27676.1 zf-HC2 domain-containing protein [Nitrospirales bacterium]
MKPTFKEQLMRYLAGNFSCQDVANLVTDYLEGALSPKQRIRFQMHLGLCFACRNFLKQMKYTVVTLNQLPTDPVPPLIKAELLRRFKSWKAE